MGCPRTIARRSRQAHCPQIDIISWTSGFNGHGVVLLVVLGRVARGNEYSSIAISVSIGMIVDGLWKLLGAIRNIARRNVEARGILRR